MNLPTNPKRGGAGSELGLRLRPEIDPAVLAAIAFAVDKVWPRPAAPPEWRRGNDGWRFSGRWWSQPVPLRRERPTAGF